MKIEQAIYGEVRSGHSLRMASCSNPIMVEIASRLDLPDTAPLGVNWSPYITGFPYGDRYVIARTFEDTNATRAGMVISHALIAPLDEIVTTANLSSLLKHLIVIPESPSTLTTLEITVTGKTLTNHLDLVPAAEALVSGGSGQVVKIGITGFEELVVELWSNLWPELRATFAFRMSFSPRDIVDTPIPLLVCTPTVLQDNWSGHKIIGASASLCRSPAAAMLSGTVDAGPIILFASELGVRLNKLADLPLLMKAYDLNSVSCFDTTVTSIRLIGKLSSDPTQGTQGKVKLINKLCSQINSVGITQIRQLRNLNETGFSDTSRIWNSLEKWVATNNLPEANDADFLAAINDSLSSAAIEPWRKAILDGMVRSSTTSFFSDAFWRWVVIEPETLACLLEHLPSNYNLDTSLASAAPIVLSERVSNTVMTLAISKHWLRLHGSAAAGFLEPQKAVLRQMLIDTDPSYIDGIRAALRRVTGSELLKLALDTDDNRILSLAAEKVAVNPSLLKAIDFNVSSAQEIWTRALAINVDSWQGPEDPKKSLFLIIQVLLDGGEVNTGLLTALSISPIADLCDYKSRAEVWPRLSEPTRTNFLIATTTGWLKQATSCNVVAPDPILELCINADLNLEPTLQALTFTDAKTAMQMIEVLPSFNESRFLSWLDYCLAANRPIAISESELLGRILYKRSWSCAVDVLLRHAKAGRSEVIPALNNCINMIGIIDKVTLELSSITIDDKWLLLEEVTADLYPTGPDHNQLWDRAGGRNCHLSNSGTGKARWHDALSQMRKGNGPLLRRLLDEIKRDFHLNSQINYLCNYSRETYFI